MYYVYLDGWALPLAPAKFQLKFANQNKTITLINDGEVNVLKTPGLSDISFEAVLPALQQYPEAYYPDGFHGASYYLDKLEELKVGKKPFTFLFVRTKQDSLLFDNSLTVSLEDCTQTESVDDGQDVTVSIKMKQYRHFGPKTVKVDAKTNTTTTKADRPTTGKTTPKTVTVKSGDTLWAIAKSALGDGSRWGEIYQANKADIEAAAKKHGKSSSDNGKWIYPGTSLRIPGA